MSLISPLPVDITRTATSTFYLYAPTVGVSYRMDHDLIRSNVAVQPVLTRYNQTGGSPYTMVKDTDWEWVSADKDTFYSVSVGEDIYRKIRIKANIGATDWVKVVYVPYGDLVEVADLFVPQLRLMEAKEALGGVKVVAVKTGDANPNAAYLFDKADSTMSIVGVNVPAEAVNRPIGWNINVQSTGVVGGFAGLTVNKKVWASSTGTVTQDESTFGPTDQKIVIGVAVSTTEVELQLGTGAVASTASGGGTNFATSTLTGANVVGWSLVNGSGGTATFAWDAAKTSIQAAGAAKLSLTGVTLTQNSSRLQGPTFTVDKIDVGQAWQEKFGLMFSAAGYTDDSWSVGLWDETAGTFIASDALLKGQSGALQVQPGYVYPTTNTTFRFCLMWVGTTGSKTFDLWLADISVAPWNGIMAPAVSGDEPWTPVFSTGAPAGSAVLTCYKDRSQQKMSLSFRLSQAAAGTVGSGNYLITVPDSKTIDLTKHPVNSVIGYGKISNNADEVSSFSTVIEVVVINSTQLAIVLLSGTNVMGLWSSTLLPFTNNPLTVSFQARFSIAQWPANIQLSSESVEYLYNTSVNTTTNDTTSFGYGSGGALIQNITSGLARRVRSTKSLIGARFETQVSPDGKKWFTAGTRIITPSGQVISPNEYQGSYTYGLAAPSMVSGNDTDLDVNFGGFQSSTNTYGAIGTTWAAGGVGAFYWRVAVYRGGANAEVPPKVIAEYQNMAASGGGTTPLQFNTKARDTHNCVTTGGSWKFTSPFSQNYRVIFIYAPNANTNGMLYSDQNNVVGTYTVLKDMGSMPINQRMNMSELIWLDAGKSIYFNAGAVTNSDSTSRVIIEGVGK